MLAKHVPTVRLLTLCAVLVAATIASPRAEERFAPAKLDAFIDAAVAVSKVVQRWVPRIQGAENQEQAGALRDKARTEMADAVDATAGITLEEYRQISLAAREDPALLDRIKKMFEARSKK